MKVQAVAMRTFTAKKEVLIMSYLYSNELNQKMTLNLEITPSAWWDVFNCLSLPHYANQRDIQEITSILVVVKPT